jgi:2-iminobutanoate/2-iminopropanoate deaminase
LHVTIADETWIRNHWLRVAGAWGLSERREILVAPRRKDLAMTTTADRPTPVDPPQLPHSPAFAQGMILPAGPTLYVGGQNGTDGDGTLLEGLGAQTAQALLNLLAVLAEAGTGPEHVAKLTIYLAAGIDPGEAYAATRSTWGDHRTAVTVLAVTPARPGALVEIDAVAMIPGH